MQRPEITDKHRSNNRQIVVFRQRAECEGLKLNQVQNRDGDDQTSHGDGDDQTSHGDGDGEVTQVMVIYGTGPNETCLCRGGWWEGTVEVILERNEELLGVKKEE